MSAGAAHPRVRLSGTTRYPARRRRKVALPVRAIAYDQHVTVPTQWSIQPGDARIRADIYPTRGMATRMRLRRQRKSKVLTYSGHEKASSGAEAFSLVPDSELERGELDWRSQPVSRIARYELMAIADDMVAINHHIETRRLLAAAELTFSFGITG